MALNNNLCISAVFLQIYLQYFVRLLYKFIFLLSNSGTLQVLMFICPTVSELHFYGCCPHCLLNIYFIWFLWIKPKAKLLINYFVCLSVGPQHYIKNISLLLFKIDCWRFSFLWRSKEHLVYKYILSVIRNKTYFIHN